MAKQSDNKKSKAICSFCGRSSSQTDTFIEGPNKPDLVISDLIMEGKDGFDVITTANKHSIPIMILTSERRNQERIIESGAVYMHKSVLGTDEFTEIFKKVLFDILAADH